ncbi:hypothetical protein PRIPAC_76370 [Pristionchus pacificus]|uniref:Uncharacterized protein n=1 Tax=Pristionchus pacificus TaxID=54126 RepID=A0A454XLK3_PRIPA|nr:hypothetical protein PRIPAC_76370 [Pristionchus pacificus]|eukprot:PDM64516.1 hypothetical protein PRIPAC_52772 [Pristionchus pacificus]
MNPLFFIFSLFVLASTSMAQTDIPVFKQAVTPSVCDRIKSNLNLGKCSTPQRIKVYCEQMEDAAKFNNCKL